MTQKNMPPQKSTGCSTQSCSSKLQAVCFTCEKLYCFKCSLQHVQKYTGTNHDIALKLKDSIPEVSKISKNL